MMYVHVSVFVLCESSFDAEYDLSYAWQLSDLKHIICEKAMSFGAVIRDGIEVSSISVGKGARPSVKLVSGEVVEADVIIGADGAQSFVRKEMLGQELRDTPLGSALFK
jgi:salicylate hydroxylase